MKLSEIKLCAGCKKSPLPVFHVVRSSLAMPNQQKAQATVGLAMMLGGSLGLAEAMGASPDVVTIAGDKDRELWNERHLCMDCWCKIFGEVFGEEDEAK